MFPSLLSDLCQGHYEWPSMSNPPYHPPTERSSPTFERFDLGMASLYQGNRTRPQARRDSPETTERGIQQAERRLLFFKQWQKYGMERPYRSNLAKFGPLILSSSLIPFFIVCSVYWSPRCLQRWAHRPMHPVSRLRRLLLSRMPCSTPPGTSLCTTVSGRSSRSRH